ncbi:MAG: hypothetical protein M1330_01205 [Armatimonadetes bacterium]|nr:hypothetical protein [Armatimonadota bacterium]
MRLKIIFCAALLFAATAAMAQVSYVFTPTSSGVNYAINNDGPFYVENGVDV